MLLFDCSGCSEGGSTGVVKMIVLMVVVVTIVMVLVLFYAQTDNRYCDSAGGSDKTGVGGSSGVEALHGAGGASPGVWKCHIDVGGG